jgi:sortase A
VPERGWVWWGHLGDVRSGVMESVTRAGLGLVTLMAFALSGCSGTAESAAGARERHSPSATPSTAPPSPAPSRAQRTASPSPEPAEEVRAPDGRPRHATLSIPAIGVRDLTVVPYPGTPDDAPGTRIQNGGDAASPHGSGGGVGPGGVGNYIVTGHRTSHGAPFGELPSLRRGARVVVSTDQAVYVYAVSKTLRISFRSEESKALQTAPVPGQPGRTARRAMITLSTCATPEDHAAGNYWADEFGNPEHRIDKIGVLVATRPR